MDGKIIYVNTCRPEWTRQINELRIGIEICYNTLTFQNMFWKIADHLIHPIGRMFNGFLNILIVGFCNNKTLVSYINCI